MGLMSDMQKNMPFFIVQGIHHVTYIHQGYSQKFKREYQKNIHYVTLKLFDKKKKTLLYRH